jgi:Mn-containing catalase
METNGPDAPDSDMPGGTDTTDTPFDVTKECTRPQGWAELEHRFVTATGTIFDLLHNFHLECGARLHKLRVYETVS